MKEIVLTLLFVAMSFVCAAQDNKVVKGFVRGEKGGPIPGVTVSAIEADVQSKTDLEGMFTITVPENVTRL